MATFAVTMEHGPAWDPARGVRDQDGFAEHGAFMDALVEDGFVIIGGPVGTDQGRALLAVQAADEADVRARLAADPWVPAQRLYVGAVEPWPLWLDGTRSCRGH